MCDRRGGFGGTICSSVDSVHAPFRPWTAIGWGWDQFQGEGVKFTVQYLGIPQSTVRHSSELNAESTMAAEVSAKIGLEWAEKTHNACCYRVLDESGAIVAAGPDEARMARSREKTH
jgi:hypothetical protein